MSKNVESLNVPSIDTETGSIEANLVVNNCKVSLLYSSAFDNMITNELQRTLLSSIDKN